MSPRRRTSPVLGFGAILLAVVAVVVRKPCIGRNPLPA
jgi:hypothetical protein